MKQAASIIALFFILLFAYTKLAGPIPFSVTSVTTQKTDTFTVSGEGKVSIHPDMALVNLGVQAQGATVKSVQQELNTRINAVSDAIKKRGMAKEDLQTTNYSVNPTYDYRDGKQKITGYSANAMLIVKVKNLDRVNDVIDDATANGANQVGGLTFDVSDKTKAQNEAREKAVKDAKEKAESAAHTTGFQLGKIVNYSESFGGQPRPIPYLMKAEVASADSAPTQVEPGTNEIVVQVSLSYDIQ